ncbi:conserved hypothetical protein [Rippkaea orientalis PCC 8801]|uniref:DUF3177 domain-containing protein n=1 Tax=Rippkaea orientalis (strain PCC 8801 / RF-1) TaxID=41431 RepID=B7JZP9_RIPO1|nr:DUF3177 family protein [Rippkaea orientalis]ACK64992.1 conserved hypothetical protein [Rippkaea orientalis PCC 8801]
MEELWFRPLVWTDYRLAVVFLVIIPIILMAWAFIRKIEAIGRLLIIYWRVASLLMITVYLMVPAWGIENSPFENLCGQIGFITGFIARILIPISLWFWLDLNDEIKDLAPSLLKLATISWRWAVTIYSSLGAIANLPFLSCAFSLDLLSEEFCQVWIEAPMGYRSIVHNDATQGFIGFLGVFGLGIYVLYFAYFLLIRLGKQGRSALEQ